MQADGGSRNGRLVGLSLAGDYVLKAAARFSSEHDYVFSPELGIFI